MDAARTSNRGLSIFGLITALALIVLFGCVSYARVLPLHGIQTRSSPTKIAQSTRAITNSDAVELAPSAPHAPMQAGLQAALQVGLIAPPRPAQFPPAVDPPPPAAAPYASARPLRAPPAI